MAPDGREIAVAMHGDDVVATNTNVDIFVMDPDGGGMHDVTSASLGADNTPRYSPDGKWLSYLSMRARRVRGRPPATDAGAARRW